MNASILKALKPGGKLVILDFGPPPGAESADPEGRSRDGHHGITPETLERELRAAGFEVLSTEHYDLRSSMTVARRPQQAPRAP
jgi:predicted methyltransferase